MEEEKDIFEIGTSFIDVETIFGKDHFFVIPNYQRGYAWEDAHVDSLLQDISALIAQADDKQMHYMGTLAVCKTGEADKASLGLYGNKAYDVIDGQQRITTIMLILLALSKYFPEMWEQYIAPSPMKYRLNYSSNFANKLFLYDNIYGNGNTKPKNAYQQNLKRAKLNIEEKIERIEDKQAFKECVLKKLGFNLYVNSDSFDARKTFETMNYRGKPLTKLELLKNKLIYLSTKQPEYEQQSLFVCINEAWESIYTNLGFNSERMLKDDEFLKAHWFVYGEASGNLKEKGDSYASDILDKYFGEGYFDQEKEEFVKNEITSNKIQTYVESLRKTSQIWKGVKFPLLAASEVGLDEKEALLLDKLQRIKDFAFVNYLILATIESKNFSSIDNRITLYKTLEQFIFINYLTIKGKKSNDLSFLNSYSKKIFNCKNMTENDQTILSVVDELVNTKEGLAIKSRISDSLLFYKDDVQGNFFEKNKAGINYILFEWNRNLHNNSRYAIELKWDKLNAKSIEHILPQHPKVKSWREVIKNYTEEEQRVITHSIGNLVALSEGGKNSSLGNKSYYVKTQTPLDSGYTSYKDGTDAERLIADKEKHWTVKQIYERAVSLLQFIYDQWYADYTSEKEKNDFIQNISDYVCFSVKESEIDQKNLESKLDNLYQEEWDNFKKEEERQAQKRVKIKARETLNGDAKAELRQKYWEHALPIIRNGFIESGIYGNVQPSPNDGKDGSFGFSFIHLFNQIMRDGSKTGLWIDSKDNLTCKKVFDVLFNHKEEIEKTLNMTLVWDRKAEKTKSCCLYVKTEEIYLDKENWDFLAAFQASTSKLLYESIVPYFDEIKEASRI